MDDMAIDVGGYRFIETDKLSSQLVWDALQLPTACYDLDCQPLTKPYGSYILKDAYGNNAGYATPVETMLGQLEDLGAGQQVHFGKALTGIHAVAPASAKKDVRLSFADGSEATASRVLFNVPRKSADRLRLESQPQQTSEMWRSHHTHPSRALCRDPTALWRTSTRRASSSRRPATARAATSTTSPQTTPSRSMRSVRCVGGSNPTRTPDQTLPIHASPVTASSACALAAVRVY